MLLVFIGALPRCSSKFVAGGGPGPRLSPDPDRSACWRLGRLPTFVFGLRAIPLPMDALRRPKRRRNPYRAVLASGTNRGAQSGQVTDSSSWIAQKAVACAAFCNRDAANPLNTTRWIEGHITEARGRVNAVQEGTRFRDDMTACASARSTRDSRWSHEGPWQEGLRAAPTRRPIGRPELPEHSVLPLTCASRPAETKWQPSCYGLPVTSGNPVWTVR